MSWESSVHLFINSANIYLLNIHCASSTVLGCGDRIVNQMCKSLLIRAYILMIT